MASRNCRRNWPSSGATSNFDADGFLKATSASRRPPARRTASPLEQLWSRPTCDVNGIIGGYTGEGGKTVIPAKASAKFSFRLVGKQNPERILQSFHKFVTSRLPPDVKAEFLGQQGTGAITLPVNNEIVRRSARALEEEWGKPTGAHGLRRLDPDRRLLQEGAWHGHAARRLCL